MHALLVALMVTLLPNGDNLYTVDSATTVQIQTANMSAEDCIKAAGKQDDPLFLKGTFSNGDVIFICVNDPTTNAGAPATPNSTQAVPNGSST